MSSSSLPVDLQAAEDRLMRFLAIEGISGQEAAIAAAVSEELKSVGVPTSAIRFDDVKERISLPTQTGNLIVTLPGSRPGPRLVFATHLDTVAMCAGAKPKRTGDRIVSDGTTALGGDNRTGCAVLVTLAETVLRHGLPHPPLTLLFTVREESGLQGARQLDMADLEGAAMAFNVDSKLAGELIIGAVGAESWDVEIKGKAAHAGVAPEKGISAMMVAALAMADAHRNGWFGRVVKPEGTGTSNVGILAGKDGRAVGGATNVVIDHVSVKGETRSHDAAFAAAITAAYRDAFTNATAEVKDDQGATAEMKFDGRPEYPPFQIAKDSPVVQHAIRAAESIGLQPQPLLSNGGLDANWFTHHGLPTVTIGAGQNEPHTVNEFVDLAEFANGCRLAVALATV